MILRSVQELGKSLGKFHIRFSFSSDKNSNSNKNYLNQSPEEGQKRINDIMREF